MLFHCEYYQSLSLRTLAAYNIATIVIVVWGQNRGLDCPSFQGQVIHVNILHHTSLNHLLCQAFIATPISLLTAGGAIELQYEHLNASFGSTAVSALAAPHPGEWTVNNRQHSSDHGQQKHPSRWPSRAIGAGYASYVDISHSTIIDRLPGSFPREHPSQSTKTTASIAQCWFSRSKSTYPPDKSPLVQLGKVTRTFWSSRKRRELSQYLGEKAGLRRGPSPQPSEYTTRAP